MPAGGTARTCSGAAFAPVPAAGCFEAPPHPATRLASASMQGSRAIPRIKDYGCAPERRGATPSLERGLTGKPSPLVSLRRAEREEACSDRVASRCGPRVPDGPAACRLQGRRWRDARAVLDLGVVARALHARAGRALARGRRRLL